MKLKFIARTLLTVGFVALSAMVTHAQPYPNKQVRVIIPFPPGGTLDTVGRLLAQKLSEHWGQQVLVESKPGAAGSIGMEYTARQPADGYTFVIGNLGPAA